MGGIKDRTLRWFIQHVIIPRREIIDRPGFIVNTLGGKKDVFLREVILPERLIEDIENLIAEKYGLEGRKRLYSAGKKFGYAYASLSDFPTIETTPGKRLSSFADTVVRYIETLYAEKLSHRIDASKKSFVLDAVDYIVCRHNGRGHIMTEGGISGIWAYCMQEPSIEGYQIQCQGRGDAQCKVVCEPIDFLREEIESPLTETSLEEVFQDENYKEMNMFRETYHAKVSLADLINCGVVSYERGKLIFNGERYFPVDSHLLYFMEREISSLDEGEEDLFNVCFKWASDLASTGEYTPEYLITEFLPSLGFGEILITGGKEQPVVVINYYPWTIFSKESNYPIIKGILSGILSVDCGRDVSLKKHATNFDKGLSLEIMQ